MKIEVVAKVVLAEEAAAGAVLSDSLMERAAARAAVKTALRSMLTEVYLTSRRLSVRINHKL